jgi:hypothetical protein
MVLAASVISFTVWWGFIGTAFAVILSAITSFIFYGIMTIRSLGIKFVDILKPLLPPVIGGSALAFTLLCIKSDLIGLYLNNIFLCICLGGVVYLLGVWSCDRIWRCGAIEVFMNLNRLSE